MSWRRLALVTGSLAVLLAVFSYRAAAVSQLDAWKVLPRAEYLSELYFEEPGKLPLAFTVDTPYAVPFTLHNAERQTTTYRYVIIAHLPLETKQVAAGEVTINATGIHTVTSTIQLASAPPRTRIEIRVQYAGTHLGRDAPWSQTQSIHFWINS